MRDETHSGGGRSWREAAPSVPGFLQVWSKAWSLGVVGGRAAIPQDLTAR
jgi:hypothetical protein